MDWGSLLELLALLAFRTCFAAAATSVSMFCGGTGAFSGAGASEEASLFNRFSRPSTRFKRESRMSVFGPRFFGMASEAGQPDGERSATAIADAP